MVEHRAVDKICVAAMALAVALSVLLLAWQGGGTEGSGGTADYASRLFDPDRVHTVDIAMQDWQGFLEEAGEEQYAPCTLTIDGETFRQVGIRAKGNNSLHLTQEYGLLRYSLKLEFDHYLEGGSYYGLDQFSLDASFQDNSYLKTWLAYDMMSFMGVVTPLCSYVWVTVNQEPWGLFLAVEEPEEGFAQRNFGEDYGQLYKPDYRSLEAENADVALRYTGDDPDLYDNIFRNAKFSTSDASRERLIQALQILSTGENLEQAVEVDAVLRYFTVQVFVMNWDSYLGRTGHNYFLYEEEGRITILPWDYNLAFGTYALGMEEPIRDPNILINYPIYTPAEGEIMRKRPLYHELMQVDEYFDRYRGYWEDVLTGYFASGLFQARLYQMTELIGPYVRQDPTAFCSYEDHRLAVSVLEEVCLLRAESAAGQLAGEFPATLRSREENPGIGVDASGIELEDLGDFDDLEKAWDRQQEALKRVMEASENP